MKIRSSKRRALGIYAAAVMLAGCGGSQTPLGPSGAASPSTANAKPMIKPCSSATCIDQEKRAANGLLTLLPSRTQTTPLSVFSTLAPAAKKGKGLIYSGDFWNSTITIFSSRGNNPPPLGYIQSGLYGPQRLFVDKNLKLYVTNEGSYTIAVYDPGTTTPSLEISSGVEDPTGLVVGSDGTVYCANVGNDTITEYPKGQTSPSFRVPFRLEGFPENLAIDSGNNLYVENPDGVFEFAPGSTKAKDLDLSLNAGEVGALEVDRSGNIIVIDGSTIDVFPAGQTQPSKEIRVKGYPFELSLSKDEKKLYVSVLIGSTFDIQVVKYPDGTALRDKITGIGSGPFGSGSWPLAVSPDNAL